MKNSSAVPLLTPLVGVLLAASCATPSLTVTADDDLVHVEIDGEPFTTVHYAAEPRPYLFPVLAPGGIPVTRGWPMAEAPGEARDHPHHQSLWFAHGDVNGHDFWSNRNGNERIELAGGVTTKSLPDSVEVITNYRWMAGETLVATEERRLVFRTSDDARIIDVEVRLTAPETPLVLGDTKEGTMAIRLHPALRVKGEIAAGSMKNSEGVTGRDCWGKRARWMEYSGPIDGAVVGVTMLDHPSNPHHPTWWHARDYGLFAANPFGVHDFEKKESGTGEVTVAPGESLVFRYRILIHGEAWAWDRIEGEFRGFGGG